MAAQQPMYLPLYGENWQVFVRSRLGAGHRVDFDARVIRLANDGSAIDHLVAAVKTVHGLAVGPQPEPESYPHYRLVIPFGGTLFGVEVVTKGPNGRCMTVVNYDRSLIRVINGSDREMVSRLIAAARVITRRFQSGKPLSPGPSDLTRMSIDFARWSLLAAAPENNRCDETEDSARSLVVEAEDHIRGNRPRGSWLGMENAGAMMDALCRLHMTVQLRAGHSTASYYHDIVERAKQDASEGRS